MKIYEDQDKAASNRRKKKLRELEKKLKICQRSKRSLVKHSKRPKANLYIPDDFLKHCGDISSPECLYLYEVWLDREIKRIQARMANIKEKDRVCAETDRQQTSLWKNGIKRGTLQGTIACCLSGVMMRRGKTGSVSMISTLRSCLSA